MANLVKTFLLGELVKGMGVTLKNFFARKDTIYFPEEKTPQSVRFRGLHHGEKKGDLHMTKPILLAIGDKYEAEIAKRKAADAPYR